MDIMKSVPELEKDYLEIVRNLDAETVRIIETTTELPAEMRTSCKIVGAHHAYWQIQAFKGDPRVIMWHPV